MADTDRDPLAERNDKMDDDLNREDIDSGNSDTERERIRSSNDRDQELEREGITSRQNRGYDEAVRGQQNTQTDPDSAASDVERDDTIED
jgi:hypothetical protein